MKRLSILKSMLAFAVTMAVCPCSVSAEESTANIDQMRWGPYWGGKQITASSQLKGKVVLLIKWGD